MVTDVKNSRTTLSDVTSAIKASSTLTRSSSEPGLFAWKQLGAQGPRLPKKEIKVEGNPNKHKNLSKIKIEAESKDVKRYEATTATTFTLKKAEMLKRRAHFDTSKPHPLYDSSMQNQIKKFLFTPWKRPQNWLNSFKPGVQNPKKTPDSKVVPIVINRNKLRSSMDLKCNKLEMAHPDFSTSTKEAFLDRHKFSDVQRVDQKLKRMYSAKNFSMGDFDLTRRLPDHQNVFAKSQENFEERKKNFEKNRDMVTLKDNQVTMMDRNLEPKMKRSTNKKFFKSKSKSVVRMSFKEFLRANKLNKEWKKDLLDTHYKLGEKGEKINSMNREFLDEKEGEKWTHKLTEEEEEEMLRDYFKRREESQNFTYKTDVLTDDYGPFEALKSRLLLTPNLKKTSKLDEFRPMTSVEFTKTNFKFGHKMDEKAKTATNFHKSVMEEIKEVNEEKKEAPKDAKTLQFDEAKERWQKKRLQEINSIRKLANKNTKMAFTTKFELGKDKDTFQPSMAKTAYLWNKGGAL